MRERGIVTARSGTALEVLIEPNSACASCGACAQGDGGNRLSGVHDELNAQVGDTVEVEVEAADRRRAQALVFVAPVVSLVLGYLAGFLLFAGLTDVNRDSAGAVIGICAAAITMVALRLYGRGSSSGEASGPRVRAIISRGHTRWPSGD